VLKAWLARHSNYRQATDEGCDCAGDIEQMRAGYGGAWKPVRDYHPYVATGDFNGDGVQDFAVVLVDRSKRKENFTLVVFNGSFESETAAPAFMQPSMDLKYMGLFYGPPRPKPWRLLLGRFESDTAILIPQGRGYKWDEERDE
jgi:hypothetical protein